MAIVDPFKQSGAIQDPFKSGGGIVDPFKQQDKPKFSVGKAAVDTVLGTAAAVGNFLDSPVRAAAGTIAGAVATAGTQNKDMFVEYFNKAMETAQIPENEWGKVVSNVLNLPFEYLDKAAAGAGEGLRKGMQDMGYSEEFAATAATALHATVDAIPMIAGLAKGKEYLPTKKETSTASPKIEPPVLKEKPLVVEQKPLEFTKEPIPKVPQDFKEYRQEQGLDVADFLAGRRSENLAKDIKAREQDSAWEHYQQQHDSSISKNDAWKLYEEQKARGYFAKDHSFNPEQGSKERVGMGRTKVGASQRGGAGFTFNPGEIRDRIKGLFTITDPTLKKLRQSLDDELYTNYQTKIANENSYNNVMKELRANGLTSETQQKLVHFYEGSVKELSPTEQMWYKEAFEPAMDIYKKSLADALAAGGKELEFTEGVFPRFALGKGGFMDRLLEGSRQGMGGLQGRYARTPSSMKERKVFALDDGKGGRQVITMGDDHTMTAWTNGTPEVIAKFDGKLKPGMEFEDGRKITQATLKEASENTDVKYFQDGVEGLLRKASELQGYARELNSLENIKKDPRFSAYAKHENDLDIPEGYRSLNINVPQLREFKFEPNLAETLEDYLTPRPGGITPRLLELANNAIIKALFLVPLPHIANEGLHWIPERGWGWVTPEGWKRISTYSKPAIESVLKQDGLQKEIAMNGGSPLYTRVANEMYWKSRTKEALKAAQKNPGFAQLAKDIGMKPAELVGLISDKSSETMWAARDIMYTEAVLETMDKVKADKPNLPRAQLMQEAIKEVEKHMPNYRIPNRVVGNRTLAKWMKNPAITIFSYYHYGMAKSFTEFAKSMAGSPKEVKTALGQMAVLGTLYWYLYPEIDKFLSKVTGKPLKMRRAGGLALMEGIQKVAEKDKTPADVLRGLVTPAPSLQLPLEMLFNREMFTGHKIYDPAKPDAAWKQYSKYAAKQITPVRTGMQAIEGKKSTEDVLTEYFGDIKVVDEQKEMKKKLKRMIEEAKQ